MSTPPRAPRVALDNARAPTRARYVVLAALSAAAMVAYIARNCLGVVVADGAIAADLGVTGDDMGRVMGAFFVAYAVLQIPGAWLGHVWGSRVVLLACALLWSCATAGMSLAGGLGLLLGAQLAAGAAQAALFPSCVNTISCWLPAARRAVSCGTMAGFMSVGGAIALFASGLLLGAGVSWRWVFVLLGAPGVLWGVWFFAWFRNRPEQHAGVNEAELAIIRGPDAEAPAPPTDRLEPTPWGTIFTSRHMGLIAGQQFFRAMGYVFYATWFPTYLKETRGVTTAESGMLSALPVLAVVVGSPVGGVIVDWIWARTKSRRLSRQGVAIPSLVGCALLILAAYFADTTVSAMLFISAGSFCAALAGSSGYSVTIDMGGRHVPAVFGTMNMAGNIGAALCPYVLPWFVARAGWDLVLVLFAGIYGAAAVCWAFLNPAASIVNAASKTENPSS